MKNILFIIALLTICFDFKAQRLLTLEEAILLQEQNKKSITNSYLEQDIADYELKKSRAAQLPQVSANLDLRYNSILQTNILPAGALGDRPREVQFGTDFNYLAGLNLTQSIYNPSNQSAIAVAKNSKNTEYAQSEQIKRDERINLIMAYYDVILKKSAYELSLQNEDRSTILLREATANFNEGKILLVDKKRVELDLANAKSSVVTAKYNLEISLGFLKKECGISENEIIDIADSAESINLQKIASFDDQPNFSNRPEIKIEKSLLLQEDLNIQRYRKTALPGIDFYANLSTNYLDNDALNVFTGRWYPFSFIGVKASVPIFDGNRRRNELEQSALRKKIHENNLIQLESDYMHSYSKADKEFKSARLEMQNAKDNVALSEEIYAQDVLLLQSGKKLVSEILESQRLYKEAQYNYVAAIYRFLSADLELRKSAGQ